MTKRPPEVYSQEQMDALLQVLADEHPLSMRKKRLRAAVMLMWRSGLRIAEVLDLKRCDLRASGEIYIRKGKGSKPRITAIDAIGKMAIDAWYAVCPGKPTDYVVSKLGCPGVRANRNRIGESLAIVGVNAGIERLHPHGLRHTFAVNLARRSSIEIVRRALGHKSLNTTQIYLGGMADEEVVQAVSRNTTMGGIE